MEGQSQNATEQAASSLPQEGYISRAVLTLRWFERKSILALDSRRVPSSSSIIFLIFKLSHAADRYLYRPPQRPQNTRKKQIRSAPLVFF